MVGLDLVAAAAPGASTARHGQGQAPESACLVVEPRPVTGAARAALIPVCGTAVGQRLPRSGGFQRPPTVRAYGPIIRASTPTCGISLCRRPDGATQTGREAGFQDRRIRPLCHPSEAFQSGIMAVVSVCGTTVGRSGLNLGSRAWWLAPEPAYGLWPIRTFPPTAHFPPWPSALTLA